MEELLARYPALTAARQDILLAKELIAKTYRLGGKLLLCGNGGSAADCEHIVGELMKAFLRKRPVSQELRQRLLRYGQQGAVLADTLEGALPAISLCAHCALATAFANDRDPELVFAQQLNGLGNAGDLLVALSTSGNARSCCYAAITAKAKGLSVLSITGETGGRLASLSDACIRLPERETYRVQELTLPVYHYLCAETERNFYP